MSFKHPTRHDISGVSCSAIVDAIGERFHHPAHIIDLVSPTPGASVFGPAVTIDFAPVRDDHRDAIGHDFAAQFYRAHHGAPPGAIVAMSNGGHPDAALAGGRKLARLHHTDIAGLVTDGRLRDFDEIASYDFVAYARGEQVRQATGLVVPVAVNVPIALCGVAIYPGDYIYATSSGVAVIPAGAVNDIIVAARAREARDGVRMNAIADEDPAEVMRNGEPR